MVDGSAQIINNIMSIKLKCYRPQVSGSIAAIKVDFPQISDVIFAA